MDLLGLGEYDPILLDTGENIYDVLYRSPVHRKVTGLIIIVRRMVINISEATSERGSILSRVTPPPKGSP